MSQFPTPGAITSQPLPTTGADLVEQQRWRVKLADYAELAKLRIAVMVLVTVAIGYWVGCQGYADWLVLLNALLGIGLLAASSCTVNQYLEIRTDLLMDRTRNRPLPSGRVGRLEAGLFATITGVWGFVHLWFLVNPTTAWLTLLSWAMYVGIYTPMKRWTSLCTAVGAIPGALPPVLGWAATGHPLGWEAWWMFGLMFLWQFPHFLAIAWLYRHDYVQADLRMLPGGVPARFVTGGLAVFYAAILLPFSLLPEYFGGTSGPFFWLTLLAGGAYLGYSVRFLRDETRATARGLLFCSLIYLPVVLFTFTWNYQRSSTGYAVEETAVVSVSIEESVGRK